MPFAIDVKFVVHWHVDSPGPGFEQIELVPHPPLFKRQMLDTVQYTGDVL